MTFMGALGLLFIALKLTGVIAWPWVWVLAPLWIGLAVTLAVLLGAGAFLGLRLLGVWWRGRHG